MKNATNYYFNTWILAGLLLTGCSQETRSVRMLFPDTKLSVLQIDQRVITFNGLDSKIDRDKCQVGISFDGFARLGIDLAKASFEWKQEDNTIIVTLPDPEISDVGVDKTKVWDRFCNGLSQKELDELEVVLCNKALDDFRSVATNSFYVDTAFRVARNHVRNFYKQYNPDLTVVFKKKD